MNGKTEFWFVKLHFLFKNNRHETPITVQSSTNVFVTVI